MDISTVEQELINGYFEDIITIEKKQLNYKGLYCIRLKEGKCLPNPIYHELLMQRPHRILYIGKAAESTLQKRLIEQELQHKKPATFFRTIGTILKCTPSKREGNSKSCIYNYIFPNDINFIQDWMNSNLEVNYIQFDGNDLSNLEKRLINKYYPFFNDTHNPLKLRELKEDKKRFRELLKKKL